MLRLRHVLLVCTAWAWPCLAAADADRLWISSEMPRVAVSARTDPALANTVRRRSRDDERAPPPAVDSERRPWLVRLALGAQASLLRQNGANQLRRPAFANLDLGYAPTSKLTLLLRVATWLSYEPFALQFVGAGASYVLAPEGIFVTAIVGVSVFDDQFGLPGDSGEQVQGVTGQVELGQQWDISQALTFTVGAHAELGTPWLHSQGEMTDVGVGLFAAIGYH